MISFDLHCKLHHIESCRREFLMRVFLIVVCVAIFTFVSPLRALSHASDFETLTIDLLFGGEGLHAIDAAVVESSGPSYEPGPSVKLREMVAYEVLDALGLSMLPVDIDSENSERYHWVGFTIRFSDPTLDGQSSLEVNTRPLQDLAADIGLKHLKLAICHGLSDTVDPRDVFQLGVSRPDDVGCEEWTLTPDEESLSIAVSLQDELPNTGLDITSMTILALAIVAAGLALVVPQSRRARQHLTRGPRDQ